MSTSAYTSFVNGETPSETRIFIIFTCVVHFGEGYNKKSLFNNMPQIQLISNLVKAAS